MKHYKSTLTKMARQLYSAFAALLIAGAVTSCSENSDPITAESEDAYLNLCFSTASGKATRAASTGSNLGNDENPANPTEESDIHNIKVWVFKSNSGDGAQAIAYKNEDTHAENGKTVNESYKLSMKFLKKVGGNNVDNIDLYILVNSGSINMQEKLNGKDFRSLTRGDLKKAKFSLPFGITAEGNAETTIVPEDKGLPISRAITGISVSQYGFESETEAAAKSINIPLTRAISKLHFFFARKADGMTDNVQVTKIEVDENIIPKESFVFPDEDSYSNALANKSATRTYNGTTLYVSNKLTLRGVPTNNIKKVEAPIDYKRGEQEAASDYMTRLAQGGITSQDLCYLRETNKAITGTIYYKLGANGSEKSKTFTIPSSGNAIRNRELVVYGYFENGEMGSLSILPTVADWEDGGSYYFTEKASSDVIIDGGDKSNNGYKVYYGDPKRGPMITLKDIDTDGKTWILQTDNPMFGFVECDECRNYPENEPIWGTQDNGDPIEIGKTYKIQDYLMNTTGEKKTIRFYVVPKKRLDTSVPHNVNAKIFITKNPADLFYINVDSKFPGDAQHIYFEQVL